MRQNFVRTEIRRLDVDGHACPDWDLAIIPRGLVEFGSKYMFSTLPDGATAN